MERSWATVLALSRQFPGSVLGGYEPLQDRCHGIGFAVEKPCVDRLDGHDGAPREASTVASWSQTPRPSVGRIDQRPSTTRYAEVVAEARRISSAGYDVYQFAGIEMTRPDAKRRPVSPPWFLIKGMALAGR